MDHGEDHAYQSARPPTRHPRRRSIRSGRRSGRGGDGRQGAGNDGGTDNSGSRAENGGGGLPITGTDTAGILGLGTLLVGAGAGLVVLGRRRTRPTTG
jgi:hypothetical protein